MKYNDLPRTTTQSTSKPYSSNSAWPTITKKNLIEPLHDD
jgi:hypothetical protein